MSHILIFKTNIESDNDHQQVRLLLDTHSSILDWHLDKEDIAKILRIESTHNNSTEIISKINNAGFICEELPD